MTISDKIRIYELSRDLNLENKDILDAAQKLSISVKSHSSSISTEDAKKIKNLINKKNSDKKILAINKPSIKKDNNKPNKEDKSPVISPMKGKPLKDTSNKNPLLIKPLNKHEDLKIISNQPKNPNKPNIIKSSKSQLNSINQNVNSKPSQNFNQDKKTFQKNTIPLSKSPAKPPIQLIAKPKNLNNKVQPNESSKIISNSGDKRQLSKNLDQNLNKPKPKNSNNKINTPELVGAPIRREDSNKQSRKQNIPFKQNVSNRPGSQNKPGMPNRPGSKFNNQKAPGIRKPVSPNELLQLQKTKQPEKENLVKKNNEKQSIESPKQKAKRFF